MSNLRRVVAGTSLFIAVGASAGAGVEGSLDGIFNSQVKTIDSCLDLYPTEKVVSPELNECIDHGVAREIGLEDEAVNTGDSMVLVDAVRKNTVESIPFNPVSIPIGAALAGAFALYIYRDQLTSTE
jgi:hypothetical protein